MHINQIQFVGSHNSYKLAMDPVHMEGLRSRNPQAALALDYAHLPLSQQLDLGVRKLELDVFAPRDDGPFVVGHVQEIDMRSHCATLAACLADVRAWSDVHPRHVPVWISFNTKDQSIDGLPTPVPFTPAVMARLDARLRAGLGDRLIEPAAVAAGEGAPRWPRLDEARGKFLLILDEGGERRDGYAATWRDRPMFTTVVPPHPGAAILVINDPLEHGALIRERVAQGYMVRTRADADTVEARAGDTRRREAAFASGAQAISTDYYIADPRFGTNYVVPPELRCNPVNAPPACRIAE